MKNTLKFSPGNAKIPGIPSFSLAAGYACPQANECLAKVDLNSRKLIDGPNQIFRCFSASQEVLFPNVFNQRYNNFSLLRACKTPQEMANLIQEVLPNPKKKLIRLHVSGDFFNQNYFDAWVIIAKNNPHLLFYTYTKSLQLWVNRLDQIPDNLKLTASKGGRQDHLIDQYNLKYIQVVESPEQAQELNLDIDHDDSHAYASDKSFAIVVHGTQKAGSQMSKARSINQKRGIMGYVNPKKKTLNSKKPKKEQQLKKAA